MRRILIAMLVLLTPTLAPASIDYGQAQMALAFPRSTVIEKRLEDLEKQQAELYHTLAEKKTAGLGEKITEKIDISGLIELEAGFSSSQSDLSLATAQFGFGIEVNEYLHGDLTLLFEEGEDFTVDEAAVNLSNDAWFSRIGLQYVPFGNFNSHFITDPLTLDLGETQQVAALGGYAADLFALSAFVFNGDAEKAGESDRIRDWGAGLTVTPLEALEFGASYLSDLADSGAGLVGAEYQERVAGYSAYAICCPGRFEISGELLGATRRFAPADGGNRPFAWNLEAAYDLRENVELAARTEGSDDFPGAAERRYGVAAAWSPWEQVSLSAEFLRSTFENDDDDNSLNVQLAFEF